MIAKPTRAGPQRSRRPAAAARALATPVSPQRAQAEQVYVAVVERSDGALGDPLDPSFFESLDKIQSAAVPASRALVGRSLADQRGYAPDDLMAIAAIGYHYLMAGGFRLAEVLFEGLTAIEPREPYYALALALTYDRLDDRTRAEEWYERASDLDPKDPRPELNRAELMLAVGDKDGAARLLKNAIAKSVRADERVIEGKARAVLSYLGRSGGSKERRSSR